MTEAEGPAWRRRPDFLQDLKEARKPSVELDFTTNRNPMAGPVTNEEYGDRFSPGTIVRSLFCACSKVTSGTIRSPLPHTNGSMLGPISLMSTTGAADSPVTSASQSRPAAVRVL